MMRPQTTGPHSKKNTAFDIYDKRASVSHSAQGRNHPKMDQSTDGDVGRGLTFLAAFILIFAVVALGEMLRPARRGRTSDLRLANNFGVGAANMLVAAVLPLSTVVAAEVAAMRGWGLFPALSLPTLVVAALWLIVRSASQYLLHYVNHRFEWLWRLHRLHHSDDAVDLSTGLRSHPVETIIDASFGAAQAALLGPSVVIVLAVAPRLSALLERCWIMTPRLHVIHHERDRAMHDSNYGDLFAVWDRLFGTYRAAGSERPILGVADGGLLAFDRRREQSVQSAP
jgi:sterol desaturase/sphingolipid hydroxylase (fatty acid hydroxylase superfamily)